MNVRDRLIDCLAERRRRFALQCLDKHGTPMQLADLADEVAVREAGATIDGIDPEVVKCVYMSLYHTHVPKLAAVEAVTYDQERDAVALGEGADAALSLLEDLETRLETP